MRTSKILAVWLLIAGLMVVNGFVREIGLKSWLGQRPAEVLSVVLGTAIVIVVTRAFLIRAAPTTTVQLLRVSLTWLLLTVAFELGLGFSAGRSFPEMIRAYAFWNGSLWPLIPASLAAAPFLWAPRANDRVLSLSAPFDSHAGKA
jgi:urea transporter